MKIFFGIIGAVVAMLFYQHVASLNLRANAKVILPLGRGEKAGIQLMVPSGNYYLGCVLENPAGSTAFGRSIAIKGALVTITQAGEVKFEGHLDGATEVSVDGYDKGAVTVEVSCEAEEEVPASFYLIVGRPL